MKRAVAMARILFLAVLALECVLTSGHSADQVFGLPQHAYEVPPNPRGAAQPEPKTPFQIAREAKSENVLGAEPWCGPLVRGLTTTVAEGKHIRFCWRDDPAAVMRPLQVDRSTVEQITNVLEGLNMKPKAFSPPSIGYVPVHFNPPSREIGDGTMFVARVTVYPDDDLDTLMDEVAEEFLLPQSDMCTFSVSPFPVVSAVTVRSLHLISPSSPSPAFSPSVRPLPGPRACAVCLARAGAARCRLGPGRAAAPAVHPARPRP